MEGLQWDGRIKDWEKYRGKERRIFT